MVQRFENKGSRGFSLVETLAVVAILVILLSLSAVAAAYYRDYLKITELDNAARDIYMAAENRAVLLGGSGQLEKALSSGGAQTLAEGGEQQASVYVAKDTAASLGLLTGGAIDPALLNGQFYIVYDTASGAVTDVFYTEGPDIQDIHYALSIAGNRDKRMRPDSGPMLGYYGGEQEARTPYTPLPAPEVLVEVENGDLLKVHVTFSVPDVALSIVGNNWMHTAKQTVRLEYEGAAIPLMNYPTISFPERHSSSLSSAAVTHTWVLDALDRADGVSGRHFYQLFSNSGMTFGGDFTVTAEIELSAPGCRPTSASGSDTGNSLFAQRSGGSAAQLENLRHLQNLDAATSRAGGKTSAVQINDIDCRGTTIKDPLDPYGLYKFASIENPELTSFDAGWTLQDGANRRNEITDLRVTKDSAKVSGAGLFAKTAVGMTFTGVRLIDAEVTGSQNTAAAGALVGSAGSGSTFRDIRAVNVKAVCPNGPAGGIAGSVAGASGEQNENLFSDCRVYWEPEEGQDNLRSLLGSDQKSNPYQYGEILHGTNAGGLAGELSGKSGTTAISKSLAASLISGTIAGGLVGNAQHTVNVDTSYADCYLKGETYAAGLIGKCKDGGTSKGSALTNVYAAGFIDCADMGFGSKAAGLFNVSGTVSGANVYTAVSYLNQTGKVTVNPGVPDNSPDLANRCYYLDPTAASTGAQPTANGAVSYDDMSTEGLFDKAMGGAFAFKKIPADTNPYNLQEKQMLNPPYSFPGLKGLPHYGDWRAYFKEPSLVYYERDSKGDTGFSGGNARELIGQLEEDNDITVQTDGYAVALMKKDLPESGSFTVTYTCLGKNGEKVTLGPVSYSTADSTLLEAMWERSEGGTTVKDEYWLAPLPDALVIGERVKTDSGGEEFSAVTSKDFYQYLRFETSLKLHDESTENASGEYFYNPHFAETVKPYVPETEGKPFIDWEGGWEGEGKAPYTPDNAAEGVRQYITETLAPGNRPVSVSVRTPRHFFHLSQYEDYYNNPRLAFQQGLSLDGHESVYQGYPELLTHEAEARKFQLQSPIGTQAKPFLGSYNGNYLPIRRVAFRIPEKDKNRVCAGLFGSSSGTLQNIVYSLSPNGRKEEPPETLPAPRDIVFPSNQLTTYLGALAGQNGLTGKMFNCAVDGVNLTTRVYSATIYIGGLCGENRGLIQNSAAESAYLHVDAANYGQAFVGGLAGSNAGQITTSYAVGRLAASAPQENAPVCLAGFAGRNAGSAVNSYSAMDLKTDGVNAEAWGFSGPSGSGQQRGTFYLNNGNFSYRGEEFLAQYEEGQGGTAAPLTYVELTAEDSPVPGMKPLGGADPQLVFPYPTIVTSGKDNIHYGDWPKPLKLGSMGVYYWEELRIPGKAPAYQLSLLAVDPGDSAASPKTISKLSTLSTAHDQGGEVTRFGYGVYNKPGHAITLGKNTPYPLLYSEGGEAGGDFDQQKFSTLEAEKKTAAPSSSAYLNKQVDEALAEQMYYRVGERFQFHSFHSYGLDGGLGGLYPNSGPAVPNGTLTLSQGGNQNIGVTFALNPLFAEALAVELPKDGKNWSAASKDVPVFTSSKNNWTGAWTLSGNTPGSSGTYPYGVRSIAQLQFIDWNSVNRDTNTVLKLAEKGAQGIASFPYLSSGSTTGNYYWTQSYDIKGERTADGTYKTYSPIAEYYDTTNTNKNRGYLDGWFGGVYDGNSYVIENVSIQGSTASCAGLFGVVYNGTLKNMVLYSSTGESFVRSTYDERTTSQWYAIGALAGVAASHDKDGKPGQTAMENCAVSGYQIEVKTYTAKADQTWGGVGVGGLLGLSNMSLSGCTSNTKIVLKNGTVANDNIRTGGLVGSCQGSIENCYAGGFISLEETSDIDMGQKGIYIGGIVGGSYMKPLQIGDNQNLTIGFTQDSDGGTDNKLTNCYSYVQLPSLEAHPSIRALYAVGGTGEINPAGTSDGTLNHGKTTYENCYFLTSEVLAGYGGSVETYLTAIQDAQAAKPENGRKSWEPKTDLGTESSNSEVTPLTYEQLAGMQAGIPGKDPALDIYGLLPGFSPVTTVTEDGIRVPGKYSYPPATSPQLRDRDYPFPTILRKDGGKYNVHYGDWPLKGFRRQTLFDENGKYALLGGSPIEIDLFVNGTAPHQEYLVLTEGVLSGGKWTDSIWNSMSEGGGDSGAGLIAGYQISGPLPLDQIPHIPKEEQGKFYYFLELTPKKEGTDILHLIYTDTDDVPYRLDVTVHVTASAELRPSRLFMFPNDTVSIAVRATDKAGHPLDERLQNGKLTLKGDPNCGSSGYLTGKTLIQEATEDGGLPTVQFTTAIPGDAPELEAPLTLGANTDFAYTVTTPDPDSPGDPSKATVQDYGGGNGGDVRIEIIQPWKDREDFIRFEETQSPDGTPQIVCTVTFPDSYPVDAEGTLYFAAAGSPTVAPMFNQPAAAWRDEAGSISFTLTYGAAELAQLPEETKVSLPLTLTSSGSQLIDGSQPHTLTLTVRRPADAQAADAQAAPLQSIDAPPPAGTEEKSAVRRRRTAKNAH